MPTIPVLIVGAGPTGLALAVDLARRGVDCRLLERAEEPFAGSRGKGLQPRTLEVLDDLGVIDEVLAAGAEFPPFRLYAGRETVWERSLVEMLGSTGIEQVDGAPYPMPWLLPQWRTEEILRERLAGLGGKVEFGTELVDLRHDPDAVVATVRSGGSTREVRAGFLVGTDGGRSTTRKLLGVGFEGTTSERERTLVGDVRVDGLDGYFCHLLTRDGDPTTRFSLWNLPGTDYHQFVANLDVDEVPDLTLEALSAMLVQRCGRTDIRLHDLRSISLHQVNARMVSAFRVGRAFLAGDAAHVHSSAGGQGLNLSVQDGYNLGWKLAAALRGAPDELLDTYEAERFPVAADVLGLSTALHGRGFQPPSDPTTGGSPALTQLGLGYRGGPLSVEDRTTPGRVRAGDRAPDAVLPGGDGRPRRLFDVFRGPHPTLLAFGAPTGLDELGRRHTGLRTASVAGSPDAASTYDASGNVFVLVRPDGYIGAVSGSAAVIDEYLARMAE